MLIRFYLLSIGYVIRISSRRINKMKSHKNRTSKHSSREWHSTNMAERNGGGDIIDARFIFGIYLI